MQGAVRVDGKISNKPGTPVSTDAAIEVIAKTPEYVSRGGLKLKKALDEFDIDVKGMVALDAGASTGGFTDCLLKNGAIRVYAVDVGYGQLDWNLRNDQRVICLEKTNVRFIGRFQVREPLDIITIDLSFISVEKVLPALKNLLKSGGYIIILVKPQFESGYKNVGKGGVVRNPDIHRDVIKRIIEFSSLEGLVFKKLTFSPIKGPKGNIEYLLLLEKKGANEIEIDKSEQEGRIFAVVEKAFTMLGRGRKEDSDE